MILRTIHVGVGARGTWPIKVMGADPYHGRATDGQPFYGSIRYDNTGQVEAPFSHDSTHFHSNDLSLVVGDGARAAPHLLPWRFRDGRFEGPRLALTHRGSFHPGAVRHLVALFAGSCPGPRSVFVVRRRTLLPDGAAR